jgi:uncharacterized protein YceH (UPF0502 family)
MTEAETTKPIRPLDATERRVLGTLIEKGKTTPDQYPLSLNALVNGCNQKNNRDPATSLDEEQVMRALTSLRQCGAAAEVYGSGKIPRYRHLAYEWLGAVKEELAILGELLLRGAQTEGDLRGRASRMDPIPDLDALRTHLDRLAERGLVVWLSPPGRGRMLTHGLLPPETLAKVKAGLGLAATSVTEPPAARPASSPPLATPPVASTPTPSDRTPGPATETLGLERRLEALEAEVAELRARVDSLEAGG